LCDERPKFGAFYMRLIFSGPSTALDFIGRLRHVMRQHHAGIRVADQNRAGHKTMKIMRESAAPRAVTKSIAAFACAVGIFVSADALAQQTSAPIVNLIPDAPITVADNGGASAATPSGKCDPYKNYACIDDYLGDNVFERFVNYYRLEWGEGAAPSDPNAPAGRRDGWPATPANTPPMPYTEFPYGAVTSIGVTRPNSVDSPLMAAIANTGVGKWMADNDFQVYGWVDPGFNFSSNDRKFGNSPIGYTVNPNVGQLDQAVLYIDRFPDTVQTDHIDWGMRLSVIYGENYRYTEAYGIASSQFQGKNAFYGYDFPMAYGELWIPQVFQGLMIRVGRYISIPDIEAQLAPNNILYTHSLTYTVDNYTNEGIVTSWQLTKNWLLQVGVVDGTEAAIWHLNQKMPNQYVQSGSNAAGFGPGVDPLYQGPSLLKDPGAQASGVLCVRYESNDGNDVIYPCLDGINNGSWGFNNLQWHGFTYYHKFDDHWHLDFEGYYMTENGVPNGRNSQAVALFNNGGTPFSSPYVNFNAPNLAHCANSIVLKCDVASAGAVAYLNYTIDPLNNLTFRPEYYWDPEGWRTGTGGYTQYFEVTLGWQHWMSPQIEFRPEISYWHSFHTAAFNGDAYAGISPDRFITVQFASDVIVHF
jgi:Putative beta-barrel porin-2, OmpL-like. bbp2